MKKIKYPEKINLNLYAKEKKNNETFYGLPNEIKFCKKCVISNQRPNSAIEYDHKRDTKKNTIHFDENGICDACNFAVKKK